jgi:hypothetical protein
LNLPCLAIGSRRSPNQGKNLLLFFSLLSDM